MIRFFSLKKGLFLDTAIFYRFVYPKYFIKAWVNKHPLRFIFHKMLYELSGLYGTSLTKQKIEPLLPLFS